MKRSATAIYIIAAGPNGPCKIGSSKHPDVRQALQVASPHRLTLEFVAWFRTAAKAQAAEAALHETFSNHALEGEWFAYAPAMLAGQVPSYLDQWARP